MLMLHESHFLEIRTQIVLRGGESRDIVAHGKSFQSVAKNLE